MVRRAERSAVLRAHRASTAPAHGPLGAVPLHLSLDALTLGDEALKSIEAAQTYVQRRGAARSVLEDLSIFLTSTLALGLVTEAQAEAALIGRARNAKGEHLQPLFAAVRDRAAQLFHRYGFCLPQDQHQRVDLLYTSQGVAEVYAGSADVLDLSALREWADLPTRRAVIQAIHKQQHAFWNCCTVDQLWEIGYYTSELAYLARQASAVSDDLIPFETLWAKALDLLEHEEAEVDGKKVATIFMIGDQAEFNQWIRLRVRVMRERTAFENLPPTQRIDRRRCRALQDWADRASRMARHARKHNDHCAERGEHRDFGEQFIFTLGVDGEQEIDDYFDLTNDQSGEVPGLDITLDPATGAGLVEACVMAMAGTVVFGDLRRILS